MTPLEILQDVIKVAQIIQNQVALVENNKLKFRSLIKMIDRIVTSLKGLSSLPDTDQFKHSLLDLKECCDETIAFVEKTSSKGRLERFIYAGKYAEQIESFKAKLLEIAPILHIGLTSQSLMDLDRDRRHEVLDHQELLAQQAAYFYELQGAHFNQLDSSMIVYQQIRSLEERIVQLTQPPATTDQFLLPKELMVNFSDIVFHEKICQSALGALYHGTWRDQPVTIKWLERLEAEHERHHFIREAKVMSRLHNDYITPFYGASFEKTGLCLLMGVMENGNLSQVLTTLSAHERFRMAQDLARGLTYLHDQDVIHGDIKPDHIGINQYQQAKWTDFGLVKTRAMSLASVAAFSPEVRWQAPESWKRRAELTKASDIYSFGLLLWTLITSKMPYASIPSRNVMSEVKRGFRETIPTDIPLELDRLIQSCWSADPAARPVARDISRLLQTMTYTPRVDASIAGPTQSEPAIREAGGITSLVKSLGDLDKFVRENAASALLSLSTNAVNQDVIRENGGIPRLVALLRDEYFVVRKHAAGVLLNLIENELNQALVCDVECITALLNLLIDKDINVRQNAVLVILKLAETKKGQDVIRDAGGMTYLVTLLSDLDKFVRENAASVLLSLSTNAVNQDVIRENGGIPRLVALLRDEYFVVRKHAAGVLLNLIENELNQALVCDVECITALLNLLIDKDINVRQNAVLVILKLAETKKGQDVIRDAGGMTYLVTLLSDLDKFVRENAASVLLSLSTNAVNQDVIRENGGIPRLVALLRDEYFVVRKHAAGVLLNLIENELNQALVCDVECITALLNLLIDKDINVRQNAVLVILKLAETKKGQDIIRDAGGLNSLIQLLDSQYVDLRKNATQALLQLAQNTRNQEAVREAGGLIPLVKRLGDSDAIVMQNALGALENLALNVINQDEIRAADGILPLVTLLGSHEVVVKRRAAGALAKLASNRANQDAVREAGGLLPLVMLLGDRDRTVKQNATSALRSLAKNVTNQDKIREVGGIEPLVMLLGDNNAIVRRRAAGVLENLATKAANQDAIREVGGLLPLVTSLGGDDLMMNRRASGALAKLASNTANKDAIREVGGFVPLVALLENNDKTVRQNASGALKNLVFYNTTNEDALRETDGFRALVRSLGDHDAIVKENASAAVGYLSDHLANKNAIRDADGLVALVNLLNDESMLVQKSAIGALRNFIRNHEVNQNIILDIPGSVPKIMDLLQHPNDKIVVYAAGALSSLAGWKTVWVNQRGQNIMREHHAIPILVALLKRTEEQINKAVSDALMMLSRDNVENIQAMIHAGARAIVDELSQTSSNSDIRDNAHELLLVLNQAIPPSPDVHVSAECVASMGQVQAALIASENLQVDYSKRLGSGGFGVVYQGKWQKFTDVAIKKLHATELSPEALTSFRAEAECHAPLHHPNIVTLWGVCVEPGNYSMVMELMAGSLHRLLHSTTDLPWTMRLSIAKHITIGLYYLHEHQIIHCDLKSMNVLLDAHGNAKLADFGLSTVKAEIDPPSSEQASGTLCWMAPELVSRGEKCTIASDIYALGMTFWEMSSRKEPFQDEIRACPELIMEWISQGELEEVPETTPLKFATLISQCRAKEARHRPLNAAVVVNELSQPDMLCSV
ncbi:MAG: protein kinase [Legionellaceae bacterium]|nr:protein kinase [Legionellaceae bacterium]